MCSAPILGTPDHRSNLGLSDNGLVTPVATQPSPVVKTPPPVPDAAPFASLLLPSPAGGGTRKALYWHHLIYAYMIENTRIYEIFRRVVHEYLHGEKLGVPSPDTQLWLRNTEELFYRDAPPFFIAVTDSHIRSDLRASRRTAYQRLFGMELNHGKDDNTPYAYSKAEAANNEFVNTFEELLREVWIGIVNLNNASGARHLQMMQRSKISPVNLRTCSSPAGRAAIFHAKSSRLFR